MIYIAFIALFTFSNAHAAQRTFSTERFTIVLGESGEIISMSSTDTGQNYVPENQEGTLIRIKKEGIEYKPISMTTVNGLLIFRYQGDIELHIGVKESSAYIRFELEKVIHPQKVEAVIWGPFNTTIGELIGEVVGVVRNNDFAIGLRTLHSKTVGGRLLNEEGSTAGYAGIAGSTATKEEHGSALQAFSINHAVDREIEVWLHKGRHLVKGLPEYTLEGGAIAIFGTHPDKVLQTIGQVNSSEGLPYQVVNEEWIRTSGAGGKPYLIASFSEDNIDEMLTYAEKFGFYSLYHSHPFKTWGHFELIPELFPNGLEGMKNCVEKANARNIRIGVHTLSNFITTNDPFATTSLNSNLMDAGTSFLSVDISEDDNDILINDFESFSHLYSVNSVLIGNEIIRYQDVTEEAPYRLLNCVRGAFGTSVASHKQGATVKKLIAHDYKTFFPDWYMQEEMINNLATFLNVTGVSHIDFDGHEGLLATGYGDYGVNYYAEELSKRVNHVVINGSSIINHYYWNINSYINWGEPWYANFRESQAEHRFSLQPFFERNYMPNMLGWFLMTSETTVEDIEWMMARAAGFNAGFAFVADHKSLKENIGTDEIIDCVRNWEEAKRLHIFSAEQLSMLKDREKDFHLEKIDSNQWVMQHFKREHFEHHRTALQPGQPTHTTYTFENVYAPQPIHLELLIGGDEGDRIENIRIEVDNFFEILIPETLVKGQTLVWDGSREMKLYDHKGRRLKSIDIGKALPELSTRTHQVEMDAERMIGNAPAIRGLVRMRATQEVIMLNN